MTSASPSISTTNSDAFNLSTPAVSDDEGSAAPQVKTIGK
jgi:hypothetical protein